MAAERTYNNLDVTVLEALQYRQVTEEGVYKCHADETFYAIIDRIVNAKVSFGLYIFFSPQKFLLLHVAGLLASKIWRLILLSVSKNLFFHHRNKQYHHKNKQYNLSETKSKVNKVSFLLHWKEIVIMPNVSNLSIFLSKNSVMGLRQKKVKEIYLNQ